MAQKERAIQNHPETFSSRATYINDIHTVETLYESANDGAPPLPNPRKQTVQPEYDTVSLKCSPQPSRHDGLQNQKEKTRSTKSRTWRFPSKQLVLGIYVVTALVIILVEASILLTKYQVETIKISSCSELEDGNETVLSDPGKPTSCADLKQRGFASGVYTITTLSTNYEYEVFCDMETDGGGWTLVASVHEDNIIQKCDMNDRWSSYARADSCIRGYTAWENKLTFGSVRNATSDDYKNEGYFSLQNKDIMIWHVATGIPLESAKNESVLRYRTTDHFLQHFGGNLYSLFTDYYKLNIRKSYNDVSETEISLRTRNVMEALEKQNASIKSHIPNWYPYEHSYDRSNFSIYDEGLYDYEGNQVYLETSYASVWIEYDKEIWVQPESSSFARKSYPFMMVTVVANDKKTADVPTYLLTYIFSLHNYLINYTETVGDIESGNFKIRYWSTQIYTANSASASEFHFIIYNEKEWRSIVPKQSDLYKLVHISYDYRDITWRINGDFENIVVGYTLLARENGLLITDDMLDNVAMEILTSVTVIPDLFNGFAGSDGLAVPITFDKGSIDRTLMMVPEKLKRGVTGGYLQLRAYNKYGFPNALCSGIKVDNPLTEFLCIGGLSNDTVREFATCGDFAGWHGRRGTFGKDGRSEYAHSEDDLNSAILIFYR